MLYGQMERELSQGESWCPWHSAKVSEPRSHLVRPGQRTVDICEEVLQNHTEQVKIRRSNCLSTPMTKASSLYQLISQYLCLSMVKR